MARLSAGDTSQREIWPRREYPFLYDVQDAFGQDTPTFNTIHTDFFFDALFEHSSLFNDNQIDDLLVLLDHYDNATEEYEAWLTEDPSVLFALDLHGRGEISDRKLEKARTGETALRVHRWKRLGSMALQTGLEKAKGLVARDKEDASTLLKLGMFIQHPEYRTQVVLEKTALRGMNRARREGLVDQEEYVLALNFLEPEDLKFYTRLQLGDLATSYGVDIATAPITVAMSKYGGLSVAETAGFAAAFNTITPGAERLPATLAIGKIKGRDLTKMAFVSGIPKVGAYSAVPIQISREYANESAGEAVHYTARNIVARASSLTGEGGWHTDKEARWWFECKIVKAARRLGSAIIH